MSNYLDLKDILQNELVGDIMLTFAAGLFLIWILVLKKGLPNFVGIILSIIWIGIMFAANPSSMMIIWILTVIFIGALTWYTIAKALGRV
jgi:hypothetical protein